MTNKCEIHIGVSFNLSSAGEITQQPKQILIITHDQFAIIEQFANQRKDAELNTIYKINECEFRIFPHIESKNKKNDE